MAGGVAIGQVGVSVTTTQVGAVGAAVKRAALTWAVGLTAATAQVDAVGVTDVANDPKKLTRVT